jgi:hypothetical protein
MIWTKIRATGKVHLYFTIQRIFLVRRSLVKKKKREKKERKEIGQNSMVTLLSLVN